MVDYNRNKRKVLRRERIQDNDEGPKSNIEEKWTIKDGP